MFIWICNLKKCSSYKLYIWKMFSIKVTFLDFFSPSIYSARSWHGLCPFSEWNPVFPGYSKSGHLESLTHREFLNGKKFPDKIYMVLPRICHFQKFFSIHNISTAKTIWNYVFKRFINTRKYEIIFFLFWEGLLKLLFLAKVSLFTRRYVCVQTPYLDIWTPPFVETFTK